MAVTPAAVDLRDITARLSALEEPYILAYFWLMVREHADRTELLEHLSHVTVQRPASWDPAAIRRAHDAHVATYGRQFTDGCFACGSTARRLFVHHVIEVQHGGSNDGRNQVGLCFPCHQVLHPWLEREPAPRRAPGFESLREIAPRAIQAFEP